jgi:hypothetical protein
METRPNTRLVNTLQQELATISDLIDEVIHLEAMRAAQERAENALTHARLDQQQFYQSTKIADIQFLNETEQGKEHLKRIHEITHDLSSMQNNIQQLEHEKTIRMQPLHDLIDLLTSANKTVTKAHVHTLLDHAKSVNPEGSIRDKIKLIGTIILKLLTFHCYEIKDLWETQRKKNEIRSSIHGLFHSPAAEEHRQLEAELERQRP